MHGGECGKELQAFDACYKDLRLTLTGEVLRVEMHRPERFNALSREMVEELRDLFSRLYWRHDIRVVVLSGSGKHFCAGLDLSEQGAGAASASDGLIAQRRISDIVVAMRRCPQPIVALVNGAASGGGFAIALASDIRIAEPATRMNAAFVRIGLSACDIGVSYFLPRMIGAAAAQQYMLTGRFIDAATAHRLGLVAEIVNRQEFDSAAQSLVHDLLYATPLGLRLTKEALNHAIDANSLEAVIALEDRNQVLCTQGPDFSEGIAAFREKRAPAYATSLNAGAKA